MLWASYRNALNRPSTGIMYMYCVMFVVWYYKYRLVPKGLIVKTLVYSVIAKRVTQKNKERNPFEWNYNGHKAHKGSTWNNYEHKAKAVEAIAICIAMSQWKTVCRDAEEDAFRVTKTRQKDHYVKLKDKLYMYVCTCYTRKVCKYKSTSEEVQGCMISTLVASSTCWLKRTCTRP